MKVLSIALLWLGILGAYMYLTFFAVPPTTAVIVTNSVIFGFTTLVFAIVGIIYAIPHFFNFLSWLVTMGLWFILFGVIAIMVVVTSVFLCKVLLGLIGIVLILLGIAIVIRGTCRFFDMITPRRLKEWWKEKKRQAEEQISKGAYNE